MCTLDISFTKFECCVNLWQFGATACFAYSVAYRYLVKREALEPIETDVFLICVTTTQTKKKKCEERHI